MDGVWWCFYGNSNKQHDFHKENYIHHITDDRSYTFYYLIVNKVDGYSLHFLVECDWTFLLCLLLHLCINKIQTVYTSSSSSSYLRWYDCAKKKIIKKRKKSFSSENLQFSFQKGIMRTWWDENFLIMWKWTLLFSTVGCTKYLRGMCKIWVVMMGGWEQRIPAFKCKSCFWLFRSFLTFFVWQVFYIFLKCRGGAK